MEHGHLSDIYNWGTITCIQQAPLSHSQGMYIYLDVPMSVLQFPLVAAIWTSTKKKKKTTTQVYPIDRRVLFCFSNLVLENASQSIFAISFMLTLIFFCTALHFSSLVLAFKFQNCVNKVITIWLVLAI